MKLASNNTAVRTTTAIAAVTAAAAAMTTDTASTAVAAKKRYPTVFVNHGGGPMPLLGKQPDLVRHMKDVVANELLPRYGRPTSIVVLSAHWEGKRSGKIEITSSPNPKMVYDYGGFPPETYRYQYPSPGSPELAHQIQQLLGNRGIDSVLDDTRGYDHGVFVPLMIMFPRADIPVVAVSLDASLNANKNIEIGRALEPLRDEGVLVLGSGYTFHNLPAVFNPTPRTIGASLQFNDWLKDTILNADSDRLLEELGRWEDAPGARIAHPREEHLLPLFMVAAAAIGGQTGERTAITPKLIYDSSSSGTEQQQQQLQEHAVSGYLFQ